MAEADTFEAFVEKERKRLTKQREDLLAKRATLDEQLASIDKEFNAIEAYEMAKRGKLPSAPRTRRAGTTGTRRTGIRQEVLDRVKGKPDGVSRADLLDAMGLKGNKSGEQSISNALSALKKQGLIDNKDGMYIAA